MSRREGGKPFASTLGYLLRLLERLSTLFPYHFPISGSCRRFLWT